MARDLNDKTIPLTSYPSLASAPPQASQAQQGAVFYAQPVAVPTGQPAVPYAQPIPVASAYVPTYQPYYTTEPQYVPAAQPVNPPPSPASIPPAAQPAAVPQNLRDLKNVVRTRARDGRGLHYKRYLSDAHRFTCKNFCSLLAIMLLWALMGWAVNGLIEGVTYGRRHHDRGFNWEYRTGNHGERGDDFPDQAPTVPSTTTNSSYISTPIISTSELTYDENDSPTWQWWHKNGTDMPSFEKVFAAHKQELGRLVIFGLLQLAAVVLLWTPGLAGMFLAVFNAIRTNSKIKFRDFFRCFCCRYYCKLAKLTLVLHIVKALLSLLFVIPGLWWSFVTMFAIPLHKEYPFLGVKGSIRISKLAIHGHFCRMFCFLLLLALVQVAGALCLLVGLLYTVPLAFVAFCFCFDDLIGLVPPAPLVAAEETVTVHV